MQFGCAEINQKFYSQNINQKVKENLLPNINITKKKKRKKLQEINEFILYLLNNKCLNQKKNVPISQMRK